MSSTITTSMTSQQVCDLLNDALADFNVSAGLSADMTADAWCDAVNDAFDDAGVTCNITPSMNGNQLADALNDAVADLADVEQEDNTIKFLHISDMHGDNAAITKCLSMMNPKSADYDPNIRHIFATGDRTAYGGTSLSYQTYTDLKTKLKAGMGDGKILMVAGNHDICDNDHDEDNISPAPVYPNGRSQKYEKLWQKKFYIDDSEDEHPMVWGDEEGHGCYWYKDVESGNKIIRIIALDQYESGENSMSGKDQKSRVGYTQKQINWLYSVLSNTPSTHYLLFLTHEPPCQTPVNISKTPSISEPDPTILCVRPTETDATNESAATNNKQSRLFISELACEWYNNRGSGGDINILPRILRAYLHKDSINFSYQNALKYGSSNNEINVIMDFKDNRPAKLIGWVNGHSHVDYVGYIPDSELPETLPDGWVHGWGDQLVLNICASNSDVAYAQPDDLKWNYDSSTYNGEKWASNEPKYRINEYVIDFKQKTLTVIRIGNKTTAEYANTANMEAEPPVPRPYGGRVRDSVTFPLTKKIN